MAPAEIYLANMEIVLRCSLKPATVSKKGPVTGAFFR